MCAKLTRSFIHGSTIQTSQSEECVVWPLIATEFLCKKKLLRTLHFSSTNFRAHRITLIYNFCPKLLISRGRNPWLSPAYAANGDRDILKLIRYTQFVKLFVPMKIVARCWANHQINFPIRGTLRGKILRQIGRPAFRERFELQIQSSLGRWVNYQITIGSNTFSKLEVKKHVSCLISFVPPAEITPAK